MLEGLGFSKSDFEKPAETFSGGWQMRIALAKVLLGRPTLLLLDEPTNHLDLDARNWLEEYLSAYPYAVILVSHDRFFLDAVVTRIAEISLRTITDYVGTYSAFLVERDARLERLRKAKHEQDEEIGADARVHRSVPVPGDEGRPGPEPHQDARQDRADRSAARTQARALHVSRRARRAVAWCWNCGMRARPTADLVVLDDISLHVERGDRIALVAPNGAGKSTLMRLLAGAEAPDTGDRREGHQVVMQYFAQDEANRLDPSRTVYETMEVDSPVGMVPMIRNILGGFLFSGDDIYKRAGVLSGGERTRLAVARMLLRPANTLLLDEPTNHLDLDSKDVLLEALEDFGGTLIFVSHDRYFVDKLATKVIAVGHGSVEVYPGTYEQFLWSRKERECRSGRPHPRQAARSTGEATYPGAQGPGNGTTPGPARPRAPHRHPAVRGKEEGGRRRPAAPEGRRRPETADCRPREPHHGTGAGDQGTGGRNGPSRLLREPRKGRIDRRQAPPAHVGGRGPHEPVGDPPGSRPSSPRLTLLLLFCNCLPFL